MVAYKSEHSFNEVVNEDFTIAPVSSSLEGMSLLGESSSWSSQLEGPKEVVGLLEVWANGVNFVDQIID